MPDSLNEIINRLIKSGLDVIEAINLLSDFLEENCEDYLQAKSSIKLN